MKKVRLKKDWVIPAGTIFASYNRVTVEYVDGNYITTLGTSADSIAEVVIEDQCLIDRPDLFEEID